MLCSIIPLALDRSSPVGSPVHAYNYTTYLFIYLFSFIYRPIAEAPWAVYKSYKQ